MKTNTLFALAFALASCAYAAEAFASHKNWLLKNGGAECSFFAPAASDFTTGPLLNSTANARTATCPIALSARWGSTGEGGFLFAPPRWADAQSALVYFFKSTAAANLSCYASMQVTGGSFYFGPTQTKTGAAGIHTVVLASPASGSGSWGAGSQLEVNETQTVRSLDFSCVVPGGGSTLLGYKVKICQSVSDCHPDFGEDPEAQFGNSRYENVVQTSGIECTSEGPAADVPSILRNTNGITVGGAARRVFCPIAPPSDDTWEQTSRTVSITKVHYKGGSTGTNCVSQGTCPNCSLKWWDRNGVFSTSPAFSGHATNRYVQQLSDPAQLPIGKELQVGVSCLVPAGLTLNGVTSSMSVGAIRSGT